MGLEKVFDTYSRRNWQPGDLVFTLSPSFRSKVLLYCDELIGGTRYAGIGYPNNLNRFWTQIRNNSVYRNRGQLEVGASNGKSGKPIEIVQYLKSCDDDLFLDFVEDLFRVDSASEFMGKEDVVIADLNALFRFEGLGYEITRMVMTDEFEGQIEPGEDPEDYFDYEEWTAFIQSYPKVIRVDSRLLHAIVIEPTLDLLYQSGFEVVNLEFRLALEDYRDGDFADCITKSCSAFESALKMICDKKGWQYNATDRVTQLVEVIVTRANLAKYLKQQLRFVAELRNEESSAHGGGNKTRNPSQAMAQFALNSAASAVLFLVGATE